MNVDSFKSFVLDQLGAVPALRSKAMFGGHGFYAGDRFFGILLEGRLYFKTDAATRKDYVTRGMSPFIYEQRGRTLTITYYEVPLDVLENRLELVLWADRAIAVAEARGRKRPGSG